MGRETVCERIKRKYRREFLSENPPTPETIQWEYVQDGKYLELFEAKNQGELLRKEVYENSWNNTIDKVLSQVRSGAKSVVQNTNYLRTGLVLTGFIYGIGIAALGHYPTAQEVARHQDKQLQQQTTTQSEQLRTQQEQLQALQLENQNLESLLQKQPAPSPKPDAVTEQISESTTPAEGMNLVEAYGFLQEPEVYEAVKTQFANLSRATSKDLLEFDMQHILGVGDPSTPFFKEDDLIWDDPVYLRSKGTQDYKGKTIEAISGPSINGHWGDDLIVFTSMQGTDVDKIYIAKSKNDMSSSYGWEEWIGGHPVRAGAAIDFQQNGVTIHDFSESISETYTRGPDGEIQTSRSGVDLDLKTDVSELVKLYVNPDVGGE